MIKSVCKTTCALAVFAVSSMPVMAVETTDLLVKGVIAPTACMPSFTGGGVIDYGFIEASTLSATDYNLLSEKNIGLTLSCNNAVAVGLKLHAGRTGSVVSESAENSYGFARAPFALASAAASGSNATGLGLDASGNKIGGMAMNLVNGQTTIDGSSDITMLEKRSNGQIVAKSDSSALSPGSSDLDYSWGAQGGLTPVPFQTLESNIYVQAYLNKSSELDLAQEIKLDGLVTFEIVYI